MSSKFAQWILPLAATLAVTAGVGRQTPDSVQPQRWPRMEVTVVSKYDFATTMDTLKKTSEGEKFLVQGVHEVSDILASKGFPREKLHVLEVCNAKLAATSLEQDVMTGLMMPCPIMVWERGGKVHVSTLNTDMMSKMYDGEQMGAVAGEVGKVLKKVLNSVATTPME